MSLLRPAARSVLRAARWPHSLQPGLLAGPSALPCSPASLRAIATLERGPLTLSPRAVSRATRGILENIDLMVCDMAGTTVEEGGLVYKVLQRSMTEHGLKVPDEAMEPWHGAKKEAVIEHFARQSGVPEDELYDRVSIIAEHFVSVIDQSYFDEASTIGPIDDGLFGYFKQLRKAGIKVALDTGYPQSIQQGLVKRLGFDKVVDGYISSYEVAEGRPYPYMVHQLMERLKIADVKRVAKVGDSTRDMEEGRNAGCGLVVGVLSGADTAEALLAAGADVVAEYVTDLPVPRARARAANMRLPDLS